MDFIRQVELLICEDYIVLTNHDKNIFLDKFKIKSSLKKIYNPIYYDNSDKYNLESKTIISAGHLRHIKGFDFLIEVANIVLKKHSDWSWNIYGEGPERERLQKKIDFYNLENNLFICGRTNNIFEKMSESSIFVLTSRTEGLLFMAI